MEVKLKIIHGIELKEDSKEELLPDFVPNFPYISSCVEFDKVIGKKVQWHWHKEIELFYIEHGTLEYFTPKGKMVFPTNSGGVINSNILHMTRQQDNAENTIQMVHIFDTSFIGGQQGSLIEQKYIIPLVTSPQVEIIGLYPDQPEQEKILKILYQSFQISEEEYAYEVKIRFILSEIWCLLLENSKTLWNAKGGPNKTNEKLRIMLIYIHEHYGEKLTIAEIAAAAYISERECFRSFHDCLHITPIEYLKNYRLQKACSMLAENRESITYISHACGFGSSSYFAKVFRSKIGCTPIEYSSKWQNSDIIGRK